MNAWILVILAGVLEVVWALGLKYSDGFSKPLPTAITAIAVIGSFVLLSTAMRTLPVGTAYAVWVGIGAVGTAIASVYLFQEPVNLLRVSGISLIVAGIIVLKLA
jgi:quaternary ammonium compound-resistance protein SugE